MIAKFLISLTFIFSFSSYACDNYLKAFPRDCKIQDRFRELKAQLHDIDTVSIYRALRFIDRKSYQLSLGTQTPVHHIYEPYSTWPIWSESEKLILERFDSKELSITEIQTIASLSMASSLEELNERASSYSQLSFRDSESYFNISLSEFEYWKEIKERNDFPAPLRITRDGSSYKVLYVEPSKVSKHIKEWMDLYNNFQNQIRSSKLSPIKASALLQREFVAIHPFSDGNGRVSGFIQDLMSKEFDLPFFPRGDLQRELELSSAQYVEKTYQSVEKMLDSLENCVQKPLQYAFSCQNIQ